jgi:hypothetical protein
MLRRRVSPGEALLNRRERGVGGASAPTRGIGESMAGNRLIGDVGSAE